MSLLLDALKKAEEAKRQASADLHQQEAAATPPAAPPKSAEHLTLEPTAQHGVSPLPELSAHLETVNADLAAVPTSAPQRKPATEAPRTPPISDAAEREAVRNVFDAKRTPTPSRKPLWALLAVAGIAAAGIGGWFWWQLQSMGGSSLSAPRPQATNTTPPPAPIAAAPIQPPPAPPAVEPAPATPSTPVAAAPMEEPAPRPAATSRAAAAEPEGPVRVTRAQLRVDPTLAQAYEQLQAGNLDTAAKSYQRVLNSDPNNTDALLGLATIALQQGKPGQAESLFIKALEADPKDVNAQAGLINLRGQSDPGTSESRLKGLLAAQPDSGSLNFALGNLYAGQGRWAEAQQAYFRAHTSDAGNPDYVFNLAAALDHMHQPKLALQYYQAALTAASSRRTGFDVNQVKARMAELQP